MSAPPIPLSVLDLAPISAGSDAATAIRNSVELARHSEALGYKRFWLAEHHFVAVASSATVTLIGLIAAATEHIRVGSAAVQIGQHTASSVVEAFGTIDALYPGRLDLGLGRSAQRRGEALAARSGGALSTAARSGGAISTAARSGGAPRRPPAPERVVDGLLIPEPFPLEKLLASPRLAAFHTAVQFPGANPPDFADAVDDVLALLGGRFTADDVELTAVPGAAAQVQVWIFGSSKGQSAQVAGANGLPFVANYHVSPSTVLEAVEAYRSSFRPSSILAEPYVVVSADVVVADDDATAKHLASTYGHWVHSIRSGAGAAPYLDPASAPPLTAEQYALVADRVRTQFVGAPDTVAGGLSTLARVTGADELVVTSVTHDFEDRKRSHELLARQWELRGRDAG
ncbi:LLM class flavin-dependent oxidoreductase [Aldersonia sp. NBC_00410]|uniref:LLM class flavin-dependent oxidoreductase n=1 Tax=Aldersonia sp. NBC_00410 TaxID=2975954 RepID=UPI002256DBBC|nr:LLM class flavin-dependent oxidoreductase [Aldersonia sp. NBC_00410]MCX5043133.1 LLM class flavin-dependent oxidoreductase [Aldersonia sp. NBC_00410]